MRGTTTLAGTSLLLLLAGCGGVQKLAQIPPECSASNALTVGHGPGRIELNSECIAVAGGSSVTLTFAPAPAVKQVRTKFRGLGNRWLDRSNDEGNPATITLPVPRNDEDEIESFKYEIHIRGVGVLDPRIVIQ